MAIKSGTYKILNSNNGKAYYGSSIDLNGRKIDHFRCLKNNNHTNRYLQNAYNKEPEFFKFIILEECENNIQICRNKEQLLLNQFWDNQDNCYNIAKDVAKPMKDRCGSLHHLFGKEVSLKTRKKMSDSWNKNREKNTKRLRDINPITDKCGAEHPSSIPICCYLEDGTLVAEYGSIAEAERITGLNSKNINDVCNNKRLRKKVGGFIWRRKGDSFNKFSINTQRKKRNDGTNVYQINSDGEIIKIYKSYLEAQRETGIKHQNIAAVIDGHQKTAGGFTWKRDKLK